MKDTLDTQFLETLLGYNARRATLSIIDQFMQRMAEFELSPVDFSILSLVHHNPGVTSRQLCHALAILPPNMVIFLREFEKRGLIVRAPHPTDGRAMGISLTPAGLALMQAAEIRAHDSDSQAAHRLSETEQRTLMRLLKKIYQ